MSEIRPTIISLAELEQAAQLGSELALTDRAAASPLDPFGNTAALTTTEPVVIGRMEPPPTF
jgi:hypothetical protein